MTTKAARGAGERFFSGVIRELKKVAPRPSGGLDSGRKMTILAPFYGARICSQPCNASDVFVYGLH